MTSIQAQLWTERAGDAVSFYIQAFGASVLHQIRAGSSVVAQLSIGGAALWVSSADTSMNRFSPHEIGGTTGRLLLVVDDPDTVAARAVAAGAMEVSPVQSEHGWLLGRVVDPFGHEWEIGHPLGTWPPA
jgi:PhnB protein